MNGIQDKTDLELTQEEVRAYYPVMGGRIANACAALEIFKKDGSASRIFDHAAGIAEAVRFLESASVGLYDNRNDYNLHNAEFLLAEVRPGTVGPLDMLITKAVAVLGKVQKSETPDPADLSDTKAFLYDIARKMTGLKSIYPGTVTRE
jgi:hypothetical protein